MSTKLISNKNLYNTFDMNMHFLNVSIRCLAQAARIVRELELELKLEFLYFTTVYIDAIT